MSFLARSRPHPRKHARASEPQCESSSRVKPCVTHDIYKGFSIRKTHIIETTCNILSYRRDTIMVHTYAYVCARGTRATRTRVARVSCTCVACVACVCSVLRVHIYTYRPNIIFTPDVRRTVKTWKTKARAFISHFRLLGPSLARISTKIDRNIEFGILPSSREGSRLRRSRRIESKR